MTNTERLRAMLDERGVEYETNTRIYKGYVNPVNHYTRWKSSYGAACLYHENEQQGSEPLTCLKIEGLDITPEQAVAATVGGGMTLNEATKYAEKFMGDYAKVLLASTLYVERDEPTDQHAFNIAERKEGQMARTLAEALATAVVGTCKLVDNDSGPDMHCTACGGEVDDEYRYFMDSRGYSRCPHCGARIIEEVAE